MKRAVWVSLFVLFIYFVSYAGIQHSIDELATVSLTESLLHGSVVVNRMEWDQERYPPQNAYGVDGNLYSKKGLGISLLIMPLFLLGKYWAATGSAQLAFLTNAFVTTVTIFVFYFLAQVLSYSRKIATLGALALGLGTLLWPYAQMLFSEPLAALGVALALLGLVRYGVKPELRWLFLCGVGCVMLPLSRSANVVLAIPFVAAVAYQLLIIWFKEHDFKRAVKSGFAFGLPLGLVALLLFVYNYGRFQTIFSFPTVPGEAFTTPLWTGLSGQLWSSGKGVIFYVPLTLMIVVSYVINGRKMLSASYLVALSILLIAVIFYGKWFDWPGGKAWGPRFLVPTMPALIMLCLPAMEWLAMPRPKWRRWLLWGWLFLTFMMQLPGVLVNFDYQELLDGKAGATYQELLWHWPDSPLLTYWDKIFTGSANPIVLHPFFWENSGKVLLLLGFLFVSIVGLHLWMFFSRNQRGWQLALLGLLTVLFGLAMVISAREDPRWWEATENIATNRQMRAFLQQNASDDDIVLLDLQENYDRPGRVWEWLNEAPLTPDYLTFKRRLELNSEERVRLEQWLSPYARVWLVMQATALYDPASTTENWLRGWAYEGQSRWIDTQRVVEFLPPFMGEMVTDTAVFQTNPPLSLQYQLTHDETGQTILLDLQWDGEVEGLNYSVQEISADGAQITQQIDRPIDRHQIQKTGLRLSTPHALLILKVYDPVNGTIFPVQISDNAPGEFLPIYP